jgi:RNA polymerase sigma factor (sigma-70 family)
VTTVADRGGTANRRTEGNVMQPLLHGETAPPLLDQNAQLAVTARGRGSARRKVVKGLRSREKAGIAVSVNKRAGARLSGDDVARVVKSAAAGDEHGWEALVREYGGLIRAIARAHRLCDARAADVAQVTWLRLLEHLVDVRDPAHVGAWLATTARRECLRVLRDGARQLPLADDAFEHESPEAPGEDLMAAERDRALWHGFACLQSSDQALLRLLLVADPRPTYEEISAALDIPIGSIGPTRARALERLRRQLDNEGTLTLMTA